MDNENSNWEYKPDNGAASGGQDTGNSSTRPAKKRSKAASWEAPEYIDHHRGAGWYLMLFLITAALAAFVYLGAKDAFAAVIIILLGIIVGIFSTQKPKKAQYEIDSSGISINGKLYPYSNYKSFALINEGELSSVNLFPIKRFMPLLSAYFESKDDEMIMDAIGDYLPYEDRKLDSIERLARRLRL